MGRVEKYFVMTMIDFMVTLLVLITYEMWWCLLNRDTLIIPFSIYAIIYGISSIEGIVYLDFMWINYKKQTRENNDQTKIGGVL